MLDDLPSGADGACKFVQWSRSGGLEAAAAALLIDRK
jgi:hypothetical protein